MPIEQVIQQLEEERNRIDRAIQVLKGIPSGTIPYKAQTKAVSPATRRKMASAAPRKTMSAAARRKISRAQKARWAKVKAGKKA